jgi:hypothetical protein
LIFPGLPFAGEEEMTDQVVAQVTLRKADGSSILESKAPLTAATLARYRVESSVVEAAKAHFEALGFSVTAEGPTGFSITGSQAHFEQTFQTTLVASPGEQQLTAKDALAIPAELTPLVADVTLPIPPERFP